MEDTLPLHGPITCRKCWSGNETEFTTADGKFRVVNDPGAWGSATPEVLVLGISKGFTQANAFSRGDFDAVPFKGFRPRLRQALSLIGLMPPDADIDGALSAREERFGWGSLVRCSLSGWNAKKQAFGAGTPEVLPAFEHPEASRFLGGCMQRFLGALPARTRFVALLGNSDGYIETVGEQLRTMFPHSYRRVNSVAHQTGAVLWVHTGHPSTGNGHFPSFANGDASSKQGQKRELAKAAVEAQRGV